MTTDRIQEAFDDGKEIQRLSSIATTPLATSSRTAAGDAEDAAGHQHQFRHVSNPKIQEVLDRSPSRKS